MNRSISGLPVHHKLPEFTQTQVHRVSDAIQPSHPLASPSPPALNPSQHQGLFQWVSSSHEVAKVLEFQLQHHSLQRNPRADLLQNDWVDLLAVQGTLKSLLQRLCWDTQSQKGFYSLPPQCCSGWGMHSKCSTITHLSRVSLFMVLPGPLEKEMATHSNCLENPRGQRSLIGYSPWGRKSRTRLSYLTWILHQEDSLEKG